MVFQFLWIAITIDSGPVHFAVGRKTEKMNKRIFALFAFIAYSALATQASPVRLKSATGCHISAIYQSDNGFAVNFSDCSSTVAGFAFSTVFMATNFSDGPGKAYLATFHAAKAAGNGVAVTYDDAVSGNLYGLGIMKHPDHQASIASKLLDVQVSN